MGIAPGKTWGDLGAAEPGGRGRHVEKLAPICIQLQNRTFGGGWPSRSFAASAAPRGPGRFRTSSPAVVFFCIVAMFFEFMEPQLEQFAVKMSGLQFMILAVDLSLPF